jgi:type II secretory pathway pseudopilin PulG
LERDKTRPSRRGAPIAQRQRGFTLVALVVITTVMTILVAAALPLWTQVMKRDREAELVFRGLQYAEAIRLFQLRFGRYPVSLEELLNANPRCLRQLWKDPMTESGQWGLVVAQAGRPVTRGRPGQQEREDRMRRLSEANQPAESGGTESGLSVGAEPRDLAGGSAPSGRASSIGGRQAMGPIQGVHSRSTETGVRTFMGSEQYAEWRFTVDLLPTPAVVPGTLNLLRANSDQVGRAFPPDLQPRPGKAPGSGQLPGQDRGRQQKGQDRRPPGG